MPRLNLANNCGSTLSSGIGTTDTSFTLTDGSSFPSAPFRCTIYAEDGKPEDGEIVEVGSISINTCSSVQRGMEGTDAQTWSAGAKVEILGTAGMYNELLSSVEEDTTPKLGGNLDANDKIIGKPVIKDYAEAVKAHGTTGGSITCNLEDGNIHTITLNAATTFTFSNPPASGKAGSLTLIINQGTTAYAVTWPASVDWVYGSAPDLSTVSTDYVLTFLTLDGGTTWRGWLSGSAFS